MIGISTLNYYKILSPSIFNDKWFVTNYNLFLGGGSGFIGSALRKVFVDNGHKVVVISRKPKMWAPSDVNITLLLLFN